MNDVIMKDVRQNVDNDEMWNWTFLNELSLDEMREFKDYIHWDQQYLPLRDMWDRWSLKDQAFFKEFREYAEICTLVCGPFGKTTNITHDY